MSSGIESSSADWGGGSEPLKWGPKSGVLPARGEGRESVHLVTRGLAYVSYRATPALELLAYLAGPGEWIGAERALLGTEDTLEARVVVESELLRVDRQAWLKRCGTDAAFSADVLLQIARRQQEVLRRLSSCLTEPIEDRLAGLLWDLAQSLPREGGLVRLPFTQEALSRMAGCTRMTLHRGISTLATMGLVRLQRGAVEVTEPARLGRYAGRAPAQSPQAQIALA